jgi:DNA-binding transcriptional LysR family regulator
MNFALLRSFLLIADMGSMSKAAERMRVSQSTLTRQMQLLEHEVGGRLLERGHSGVALTNAGQRLMEGLRPIMVRTESLLAEVGQLARGKSAVLRIGYLGSIASEYLNPALKAMRQSHPSVKVILFDLTPGEQLDGLRAGQIDLAMLGETDRSISREFFVKSFGSLSMDVALAEDHPLAKKPSVCLKDLRGEIFVSVPDRDVPGYTQWLMQLCRKVGYRPRFGDESSSLTHALTLVAAEHLVILLPRTSVRAAPPGVLFRGLREEDARWNMLVAWQRGKVIEPVRAMVDTLGVTLKKTGVGASPGGSVSG